MAKTKAKSSSKTAKRASSKKAAAVPEKKPTYYREAAGIVCLILAVFTCIGYFSTDAVFIGLLCNLVKGLAGWGFYLAPPFLFIAGIFLLFFRKTRVVLRTVSALLLPIIAGGFLHLLLCRHSYELGGQMFSALWKDGLALVSGGVVGGGLSVLFTRLFSRVGGFIILFVFLALLTLSVCNMTLVSIFRAFRDRPRREKEYDLPEPEPESEPAAPVKDSYAADSFRKKRAIDIPLDDPDAPQAQSEKSSEHAPLFNKTPGVITPDMAIAGMSATAQREPEPEEIPEEDDDIVDVPLDIPFMDKPLEKAASPSDEPAAHTKTDPEPVPTDTPQESEKPAYVYPPLDLLASGSASRVDSSEEIRLNTERLEAAFRSFGVNVHIISHTRGPTVTRYEAELEAGIKLNRLTSLSDDIALSLGASGVRIAAMPNKISTVGIEVPNKLVSRVMLRDIIDSPEFRSSSSALTFAIGKNIGGEAVVGNIAKLPHLLVAGTTGSGKSVCLNSLIISILYKSTPDEVRFIMIDPKMVEFRIYNGIPHLLIPVVTDVKKAAGALQWAVVEMMKRYRLFSEVGARDIEGYNKLMRESEDGTTLPQITVVIDELADLMLQAAKEVEESICRVAQMGRAAGVHLIIATQSPRADVITGLMKANIPSRIALKVSSSLESRIILDAGGNADKLVGNGDMLYAPIGINKPIRIQGTWVSDSEREKVVQFIKKSGEAEYAEDVISHIDKAAEEKNGKPEASQEAAKNEYDDLLPQAVDVVFESGQASVSMLQRRLKLGYSRAARIVDQMEEIGIVGPFEGSKPRQLLITRQQWHEMQFVNGTAPTEAPAASEPPAVETHDEELPF